jgi:hypothetical protein
LEKQNKMKRNKINLPFLLIAAAATISSVAARTDVRWKEKSELVNGHGLQMNGSRS